MADLRYTVDVAVQGALANLDKLSRQIDRVGRDFDLINSQVNRFGMVLTATLTASGVAAGRFADQINDISAAFNLSTADVLGFGQALELAGGRFDNVNKLFSTLSRRQQEVRKGNAEVMQAFYDLGISAREAASLTEQALAKRVIDAIAKLPSASQRAAASFELLGKSLEGVDLQRLSAEIEPQTQKYARYSSEVQLLGEAFGKFPDLITDINVAFAVAFAPLSRYVKNLNVDVDTLVEAFRKMAAVLAVLGGVAVIGAITKLIGVFKELNAVVGKNKLLLIAGLLASVGVATYEWLKGQEEVDKAINDTTESLKKQNNVVEIIGIDLKTYLDIMAGITQQYKLQGDSQQANLDLQRRLLGLRDSEKQIITETARIDEQTKRSLFNLEQQFNKMKKAVRDELLDDYKQERQAIIDAGEAYKKKATETIEAMQKEQRTFEYGWKTSFEKYVDEATNAAQQAQRVFQTFTRGVEDLIINFVKTGKLSFKDLINSMIEEIVRSDIRRMMAQIFSPTANRGSLIGGGIDFGKAVSSIGKIFGFASGGVVPGNRPILVGEQGPELFMPPGQGNIIPNNQLVGTTNVVYNISAVDAASFRQMVARDPEFLYSVTERGRQALPRR